MYLDLWLCILLFIFASIGFLVFIVYMFGLFILLVFKERPFQYDKNSENCPYKIEKD